MSNSNTVKVLRFRNFEDLSEFLALSGLRLENVKIVSVTVAGS